MRSGGAMCDVAVAPTGVRRRVHWLYKTRPEFWPFLFYSTHTHMHVVLRLYEEASRHPQFHSSIPDLYFRPSFFNLSPVP